MLTQIVIPLQKSPKVLLSGLNDFVDDMIDASDEQNDSDEDSDARIEVMYDEGNVPIIISYDEALKHCLELNYVLYRIILVVFYQINMRIS